MNNIVFKLKAENREKDERIDNLEKRITNLEIAHATLLNAMQDEVSYARADFLDRNIERMHRASSSVGGFPTTTFQGRDD